MTKLKLVQFSIIFLFITLSCSEQKIVNMNKILIITAGHEFDPSFFKIFDSFSYVEYDTISQPKFNERLKDKLIDSYDALVFYDMWQDITEDEKTAYIDMLKRGKGIVFLHHSLVAYQKWDEFEKIIGGKYIEKDFYDDSNIKVSTYTHDINMEIKIVDKNHPVTINVKDFIINDEGYQNIKLSPGIHQLLAVSHPDCSPIVGWSNHYGNSNIVYLLLGHGVSAYKNENYRKLINNSINWVSDTK